MEAGISADAEYVLTWPFFNSKILGSSFKRCSCLGFFFFFSLFNVNEWCFECVLEIMWCPLQGYCLPCYLIYFFIFYLNYNSFDINKVLEFGALLASGGQVCISSAIYKFFEGVTLHHHFVLPLRNIGSIQQFVVLILWSSNDSLPPLN